MKYKLLVVSIVFLFVFVSKTSFGQLLIEGVLYNKSTEEPIPFATVGIIKLNIGTSSNADGSFTLWLNKENKDEYLLISAIGYHPQRISVASLVGSPRKNFYLEEKVTQLDAVVVNGAKVVGQREKTLGNTQYNTGTMRLDDNSNGGAMALLISHHKYPYRILKTKLWVAHSSLPSFKVRVRVMEVDPDTKMPGKDIMEESVVATSEIQKGWLEFNLAPKNVVVNEPDFFIVFEWVMDKTDRQLLAEQVKAHLAQAPDALTADTIEVGGKLVNERIIKDFKTGVWFGALNHQEAGDQYICYYRLNALADWKLSVTKLTAVVTFYD